MLDLRQILESKTIVYWSSDPFLWLGIWPKKGLWIQFCLCVTSHVLVNPFAFGIQALNFSQDYLVVSWWTWSSKVWTKIKLQHLQLILSYIMSSISSLLHQEDVDKYHVCLYRDPYMYPQIWQKGKSMHFCCLDAGFKHDIFSEITPDIQVNIMWTHTLFTWFAQFGFLRGGGLAFRRGEGTCA